MKIIIDSREQKPYLFQRFGAETKTATLQTGDYSIAGTENLVAVERKELSDILNCLGSDRERFFRELERLRSYESAAIVIEAPLSIISFGRYNSRITPKSAVQSLIAIEAQYRLPIHFARDRQDAEEFVYDFLRHYQNMIQRRYKACCGRDNEKVISNNKTCQTAQKEV